MNKKEHPSEAFEFINYVTLEAQMSKHCYKEYEEESK